MGRGGRTRDVRNGEEDDDDGVVMSRPLHGRLEAEGERRRQEDEGMVNGIKRYVSTDTAHGARSA